VNLCGPSLRPLKPSSLTRGQPTQSLVLFHIFISHPRISRTFCPAIFASSSYHISRKTIYNQVISYLVFWCGQLCGGMSKPLPMAMLDECCCNPLRRRRRGEQAPDELGLNRVVPQDVIAVYHFSPHRYVVAHVS